jgi:hypothetical protein
MRPESVRYGSDRGRRGRMAGAGVTRRATRTAERAALEGKPRAANSHTSLTQDVFQREQSRSVDDHDDRSASAASERPAIAMAVSPRSGGGWWRSEHQCQIVRLP